MNLPFVNNFIQPDLVIDVGAGRGHWYSEAKAIWPDAQFFLIEANDECSEHLESLNVDFTIEALSDEPKTVTFYTLKGHPCACGNSYYLENTHFYKNGNAVAHEVQTYTLDK